MASLLSDETGGEEDKPLTLRQLKKWKQESQRRAGNDGAAGSVNGGSPRAKKSTRGLYTKILATLLSRRVK
ncbi:MAG: hypothetical protein IPN23_10675 [Elusimicrobia bacterium]|nr:hypothetical protein [Elusimicrobiota bacterium]